MATNLIEGQRCGKCEKFIQQLGQFGSCTHDLPNLPSWVRLQTSTISHTDGHNCPCFVAKPERLCSTCTHERDGSIGGTKLKWCAFLQDTIDIIPFAMSPQVLLSKDHEDCPCHEAKA